MEQFKKLLKTENSDLAWLLRLGLQGVLTQLQEGLKEKLTDPGRNTCEEVIEELNQLLQEKDNQEIASLPREDTSNFNEVLAPAQQDLKEVFVEVQDTPSSTRELKLSNLLSAFLTDPELSKYIGEDQFNTTNDNSNDADLWHEMQRLLLRVPEPLAKSWRDRSLKLAAEVGAKKVEAIEDKQWLEELPFIRNEPLYSGLKEAVEAKGFCLSDRVGLDERLTREKLEDQELKFLGGVVSICLKFIELDPCLHHALKSVERFGVRSLQLEEQKSKYIKELSDRFQRVLATHNHSDPTQALRARLDLDEAIHSLVYLPPADRFSWWGKLQQESRRALDPLVERARKAGYNVLIRPLWGPYGDVYRSSKDDLELKVGGVRGEVLANLRIYAKINEEVLPGRVLFSS